VETKVGNYEVTPETLWPIAKSLMNSGGPKAPTAVHGPLGIIYHLDEKANVTVDCLENQFTSHDPSDENHERRLETRAQILFAFVDDTSLGKVRPCDTHKLVLQFIFHW
jgi:hypothetical protein